ncbi:MAG: urea ABC transporter permease subunit UrtB [Microvirga sp.]|nr:urea ABC transporter permease subunit UrtB [Microvirga sp.]
MKIGRGLKFVRFLRMALIAITTLAIPAAAVADPVDDALSRFAGGSFNDTQAGIEQLVATGHETAADVIGALGEGNLLFRRADQAVFYRDADGVIRDAKTGEPSDVESALLQTVRVNNRVRRVVQGAIGGLTLMSPDPARRLSAANATFRSRDPASVPLIEAAIAQETSPGIRKVLVEARAALILPLASVSLEERLAAADVLAARGDQAAMVALRSLPADAPEELRAAADASIATIERRQTYIAVGQNVAFGISLGSVLLLAAIGLAITFGVMGVINMAHGEMVIIGAYTTYVVQQVIRAYAPGLFDASLLIAIPTAFIVAGAIGIAIERGIIRWLYGRPLETLLATWGLSLVLQQAVRTIFGPTNKQVGTPSFMQGSVEIFGIGMTLNRVSIVLFALTVFILLLVILHRTTLGLQVRAVTQNRRMAGSMGIRTGRVDALTFGLGSGIAGIAGVALTQIDNVSPNLGQGYIIDSFLVVVFGGVGSLWGTLIAAMSIGVANKMLEPYAGAVLGKIILLIVVILFIQKRPRGLFAQKGRAVEA